MQLLEIGASGLGLAAGALAAVFWTVLSARLGDDGFWPQLHEVLKLLLADDQEDQFFKQYLRLLPLFLRHILTKLLITLVAFSPVAIFMLGFSPLAKRVWYQRATHVEVAPPQELIVRLTPATLRLDETNNKIPYSDELSGPAQISTIAGEFRCATLMQKQAYSSSVFQQLFLSMIGFKLIEPENSDNLVSGPTLLLQPVSGDNNSLWPYLNDWEFDFFAGVSFASIVGLIVSKVRRR